MGFVRSFIFSRTVLGILIFACFIVTGLDLYIDSSHTKVVNLAAIEIAKNELDTITQLSRVLREGNVSGPSGAELVEALNQKLNEIPGGMTVEVITADSREKFQQDAYAALRKNPSQPFYYLDEGEDEDILHYAAMSQAFSGDNGQGLILQMNIPMGGFQALQKREATKTLWVLIVFGVAASLCLAVFVGYTRHSGEVLAESQQKDLEYQKQLTSSYERFFPHQFLDVLQKKNILEINLGDQTEKSMAVMFGDIRNFTSVIEKKSPAESFKFINGYLAAVGPVIREHSGFIDKFIGDAIMALFYNCNDALYATVQMLSLVRQSALKPENLGKLPTEIGVGLHYGTLMVGTVGEAERMDGTVISDVVNVASRIEGLNKTYGTNIIISDQFLENLGDKEKFKIRFLDHIYMKGKSYGVKLYEVFDVDPPELVAKKEQIRDQFQNAVNCYQNRQFQDAINILNECKNVLPEDRAIGIYVNRATRCLAEGPKEGWDPIGKLSQKDDVE